MSQHVGGKLILSKIIVVDSHIRYLNNWINKRIFIFISELNILYYIKLFKCHDSMILIYVLYFLYSNQLYNSYKYYICVISSFSCLRVILVYRYIRLSSILLELRYCDPSINRFSLQLQLYVSLIETISSIIMAFYNIK